MKLLSLPPFFSIVNGALRFGCSTVSIQSLDPVVQPGVILSAHLHQTLVAMRSKQIWLGTLENRALAPRAPSPRTCRITGLRSCSSNTQTAHTNVFQSCKTQLYPMVSTVAWPYTTLSKTSLRMEIRGLLLSSPWVQGPSPSSGHADMFDPGLSHDCWQSYH